MSLNCVSWTHKQRFQKEFFENGGARKTPKTFTTPMVDEAKKTRQTDLVVHRVKKLNDEEQEIQEKPVISEASRRIGSKKTQNIPIEFRYQEELKLKEAKLQKLKLELEQAKSSEEKECTFKPAINSKTGGSSSRPDFEDPVAARENKEKRMAKLKLDYLLQESQNLTFKPKLNAKSEQIMAETEELPFLERVEVFQAHQKEKREQLRRDLIRQEAPFQPNLQPQSTRSISAHKNRKEVASRSKSARKIPKKEDDISRLKQMVKKSKGEDPKVDRKQELAFLLKEELRENGYQGNRDRSVDRARPAPANAPKSGRNVSSNKNVAEDRPGKEASRYVPSIRNLLNQSHLK
jgi:hypothetical protein